MVTPMISEVSVETTPIISEMRAPWAMPAATSRPSMSEPSHRPSLSGGWNGAPTMSHGSSGNNQGAETARTTTQNRMNRPIIPVGWRRNALKVVITSFRSRCRTHGDARIDHPVDRVSQKIERNHDHRHYQKHAEQHRVVALQQRVIDE